MGESSALSFIERDILVARSRPGCRGLARLGRTGRASRSLGHCRRRKNSGIALSPPTGADLVLAPSRPRLTRTVMKRVRALA